MIFRVVRAQQAKALWALTFACGAAILCAAALVNGAPILFPDTLSYLLDGGRLIRLSWPGNERPVFYGLAIWLLHQERTIWPVLAAQGLILTHLVWLTLRVLGAAPRRRTLLALVAGLAIATPLSWYSSHVLPDVFAGALVLAMFLLGACGSRLSHGETIYLLLLATACICFHLSHLLLAAALALLYLLAYCLPRMRGQIRPVLAAIPILLGLSAFFSFSLVVYHTITLTPKSPPFLLARIIADGPGRAYLQTACARTPPPFILCNALPRLPATENDILWDFLAPLRTKPIFWQVRAEQAPIVVGTLRMFPAWTAYAMLQNTLRQLVTIDAATQFGDRDRQMLAELYAYAAPNYDRTLQGRGLLNDAALRGMNRIHAAFAVTGLFVSIALAWSCWRRGARMPTMLLCTVLVSLLANAFVTGALSGVFGRYQGRLIWLLPFCAAAFVLVRRRLPRLQGHSGAVERAEAFR